MEELETMQRKVKRASLRGEKVITWICGRKAKIHTEVEDFDMVKRKIDGEN